MSIEENKAIVRRYAEVYNSKNLAILDEVFAPDVIYHDNGPVALRGIKAAKALLEIWFKAFPDYTVTIEDELAEGDTVVVRCKDSGTHTGEFSHPQLTIPPTGKRFEYEAMSLSHIVEGRIVEVWEVSDTMWLRQLAAKP